VSTVAPVYFADLAEGHSFAGTDLTVTETHVVNYAGLTGDYYKLHMNAEAMKDHPFGQRVAHGPLTVALAMGQLAQRITHENWQVEAAIGMTEFRFLLPVFIGDTLHFEGVVGAGKERETNGFVPVSLTTVNHKGEPVLTGSFTLIVAKGPS
jgi:acyl dehydratase